MSLLEVEEKGLRRPPTPLEAFKHHLASQPRIFVEQVFKVCAFYPIVFLSFPWTVWKISCIFLLLFLCLFLAYLFAICFYYFAIDFHAQKMKNSPNVNGGFKKLELKIACLFFLLLSHPLLLIFHGLKFKIRGLIF